MSPTTAAQDTTPLPGGALNQNARVSGMTFEMSYARLANILRKSR